MKLSTSILLVATVTAIPTAVIYSLVSMINPQLGVFVGIFSFLAIFCNLIDWMAE